ncbi:MAG: hypothetical protein HUJ29_08675 [Gammaproteobacteria bacterium]|nr:hypothetical protein [Gammaproteobacteria bacterium]
MAEEKLNDFLLDQELDPDDLKEESELPDDIDAILDAVEEEDLAGSRSDDDEAMFSDEIASNDILDEPVDSDEEEMLQDNDLDQEVNIAAIPSTDTGDDIPLVSDVIDPNDPPHSGAQATTVMSLDDEMMFAIMVKIQAVVEESVSNEIGKIANSLSENVVQDVKEQLPGLLSEVLKKK